MKVAGKSKLQYFVEDLINSLLTLLKVILMSKYFVPKIKVKDKRDECVILGNSPSLKETLENNEEFFAGKDLVVVNFFWKSEFFPVIKPKYFMILSMNYWATGKTDPNDEGRKASFKEIAKKVDWPMYLIVPALAKNKKDWNKELLENKNISLLYLNITPVSGFSSLSNFLFQHNLGLPRPHNVLIPSIKMAIDLNYESVYIFGAEHSYLKELFVDDNNIVWLTQKHFYDSKNKEAETMTRGITNETRTIAEILMKFVHSFNSYWVLKNYADSENVKIFNSTRGSFIDAFERKYLP